MGQIIVKNAVERKPAFLYYIDGEGTLCEYKMSRSGKKKKEDSVKKVKKVKKTKKS